ncbi:MAG TPA: hypothetical protein VFC73_08220 [Syntrophomonadaceae bacterium]|nr:hypothetical protein [Syntrophomonadaceae bacterium]
MRDNDLAKLQITCPNCKRSANEYNWTLKTAAYFSQKDETCPTVIGALQAIHNGEGEMYEGFRMFCPLCSRGVNIEEIEIPGFDEVEKYVQEVGEDYCAAWL